MRSQLALLLVVLVDCTSTTSETTTTGALDPTTTSPPTTTSSTSARTTTLAPLQADIVFWERTVITMDPAHTIATGLALIGDRIAAVGDGEDSSNGLR